MEPSDVSGKAIMAELERVLVEKNILLGRLMQHNEILKLVIEFRAEVSTDFIRRFNALMPKATDATP